MKFWILIEEQALFKLITIFDFYKCNIFVCKNKPGVFCWESKVVTRDSAKPADTYNNSSSSNVNNWPK